MNGALNIVHRESVVRVTDELTNDVSGFPLGYSRQTLVAAAACSRFRGTVKGPVTHLSFTQG